MTEAEMNSPVSFREWVAALEADVETTMIYTHVLNKPGVSVRRSLDGLA